MKANHDIKFTILFVCSGNSCRSPMAAGLLQKKLYPEFGKTVRVHSAGTLGIYENPATLHAIRVSQEKGVDISTHRSKGVNETDIAEADIIFALAEHHKDFLDRYYPHLKDNIFLMKSFSTGADKPSNLSIEDPIGGDLKKYRKTINEIEKELERILPQLKVLIHARIRKHEK